MTYYNNDPATQVSFGLAYRERTVKREREREREFCDNLIS